jgi:hypothetical protein
MSEEWGPWIEHDGKGCPCVGQWAQVVGQYPAQKVVQVEGIVRRTVAWDWSNWGKRTAYGIEGKVLRYRIRKPRALIELRDMIADLPNPAERVDA